MSGDKKKFRSRRDWTEEERKAHYRAIEAARREVMEELGPMQNDALRRFGTPPSWTDEELRRLREGYEHGRDLMDRADAIDLGAVLEDWSLHDNDDE